MTDDLREMLANFSQPKTLSQEKREETLEDAKEESQQPSSDLLVESDHFLGELDSQNPCSQQTIKNVVDFLQQMEMETGVFDQSSGKIALRQGQILNALKKHLQMKGGKKRFGWRRWAESNIKFIGKRKMQNLMQIAESSFLHPYAAFGVERLLKLLRVIKDRNESDPVGSFLLEHGIDLPENGNSFSAVMKTKVDEAIASAKTEKRGQIPACSIADKFHRDAVKIAARITSILESQNLADQVDREIVVSLKSKIEQLESAISD